MGKLPCRVFSSLLWTLVLIYPVFLIWKGREPSSAYLLVPPLSNADKITYMEAVAPPTENYKRTVSFLSKRRRILFNSEASIPSLEQHLDDFVDFMMKPKVTCRKLVRLGGHSCHKLLDGDKIICLDPPTAPRSKSCFVYSFGVGNDFSFDADMATFGCEVYAFDDDYYHAKIVREPEPGVHFIHIRLASGRKIEIAHGKDLSQKLSHTFIYRPLDNIMFYLRQYNASIDILKIDIEGPEWEVLQNSLFQTKILERTKQLCLEIHLKKFYNNSHISDADYINGIKNYTRIFRGLEDRGLRLANYEPNYRIPDYIEMRGRIFPLFAEQLWINVDLQNGSLPSVPTRRDFEMIETI